MNLSARSQIRISLPLVAAENHTQHGQITAMFAVTVPCWLSIDLHSKLPEMPAAVMQQAPGLHAVHGKAARNYAEARPPLALDRGQRES